MITKILLILLLASTMPIAQCTTYNFPHYTVNEAPEFCWQQHASPNPDIFGASSDTINMTQWKRVVKFSATSNDQINFTLRNHNWQNRKIKLYIDGKRKAIIRADDTGMITFHRTHPTPDNYDYILKPRWSWRDLIAWITSYR